MKLFCIPYAGGSAAVYYPWRKLLRAPIQVIPLELAGRGGRIGEPFYRSIADDGAEDLFDSVRKELDGSPFAIFGHSMGTLFAYELTHRIARETGQSPALLLLSGRGAPHTRYGDKPIHGLPDGEFQDEVLKLGGTPAELFEHKELCDLYMPILRADYRLAETYRDPDPTRKLSCDLAILRGVLDRYGREEAVAWSAYSCGRSVVAEFEGGHFFIQECRERVLETIQQSLTIQLS